MAMISRDMQGVTDTLLASLLQRPELLIAGLATLLATPLGLYFAWMIQWNLEHIQFKPRSKDEHQFALERVDQPDVFNGHTLAPPLLSGIKEGVEGFSKWSGNILNPPQPAPSTGSPAPAPRDLLANVLTTPFPISPVGIPWMLYNFLAQTESPESFAEIIRKLQNPGG